MDCPHRIPPSGTPVHHHRQNSNTRPHTRSTLDTITGTDTGTVDQGCNPNHADMEAIVAMTPTEAVLGHMTGRVDATIGVLCNAITPVLIIIAVTCHIKGHPPIEILQLAQEIAANPTHALHISQVRKPHINLHPVLAKPQ